MRIWVNRKTKHLFCLVLLFLMVFGLLSVLAVGFKLQYAVWYVLASFVGMGMLIFVVMYLYFREQDHIIECAVMQIQEYISGNHNVRIACHEEGELYRLFHEVNSLVTILNAHAENEGNAKRFLKDMISDISHQLKTPLAALNLYNGILQEESIDVATVQEFTARSEQELDRIATLVQNLLKITKLDAGTIVLEKTVENLSDMMHDIQNSFSYQAEQDGKTLIFSGSETVRLFCDRHWLTEAISNIVKNALDHTKSSDTIHITWTSFASIVQIVIKDTGSGIHPEDLPHIFKRFYRSRFSQDIQGIGLGLSLSKAVIEAHNGTMEVDSALGVGTTFTLNFVIPTKL